VLEVHYPIAQRRLDNGLRVLASHDPAAPGVAVNLWFTVGSADDPAAGSGLAHLFEHLMFAGSAHVAPGEHLALIQALGGTVNATTSFDRTNYFETVPTHAAELALWLEADRLASLTLDRTSLDTQREVVKEEKRQRYDNVPYGDQLELLLGLNFPAGHPYATPTIGSMDDLDAATLDSVRAFHEAWYRPETASLVVVGPLPDEEVFALADRSLGAVRHPVGPPGVAGRPAPLPAHRGEPRRTVRRPVPAAMLHLGWRTPPLGHPDEAAVQVALDVLGAGQACRLHRRLVRDDGLADTVGVMDFGLSRGSSLSTITARPRVGRDLGELEAAIVEELERLRRDGPTTAELDVALAGAEREWCAHLSTIDTRADQLNEAATLLGDAGAVNRWLSRLRAVRAADVARVTASWLAPEARAVLHYLAKEP